MTQQERLKKIFEENAMTEGNAYASGIERLMDLETFIQVASELLEEKIDARPMWERIITDARWYDGTPQSMEKLIDHFTEAYQIK